MNDKYMEYMISEGMSQHTVRAYTSDINGCLEFIDKPENEISYADLISWKASIVGQASATVARKVVSIKKYFEYPPGQSVSPPLLDRGIPSSLVNNQRIVYQL